MLDTDTASYVIKGNTPAVDARLAQLAVSEVCISSITRAELRFGARRLSQKHRIVAEVELFLSGVATLAWGDDAADTFAEVRSELERGGTPIGIMDTMIAAHAVAVSAILVTNNTKHFQCVRGL